MRIWEVAVTLTVFVCPLSGQWTLEEVVRRAGERYAGVEVSLQQAAVAAGAVQQARLAYLPHGDFYAQVNRATRNNVYGMMLPNQVIPPISGPVSGANAGTNVWGTATGFLVNWEPFDLGQRAAKVASADAGRVRAQLAYLKTRFEVEAAAADAFLTVVAADETVKRAQAAVDRAASLDTVVAALAKAGLRPGADSARAKAELAAARAQVILAEQAARVARIALTQLTGGDWADVHPEVAFTRRDAGLASVPSAEHPATREQEAAVREAESRKKEADISWRPRFNTQTALFARGAGPGSEIGPNFYNWGIGFSVLFPFLDLPSIHTQQMIEKSKTQLEAAKLKKLEVDLNAEMERAKAAVDSAARIAEVTPVQLEAARAAHDQARARYESGLAGILDVAEAQRLLLQAEIDDSLARLNIWRANLAVATASGSLTAFLEKTR